MKRVSPSTSPSPRWVCYVSFSSLSFNVAMLGRLSPLHSPLMKYFSTRGGADPLTFEEVNLNRFVHVLMILKNDTPLRPALRPS